MRNKRLDVLRCIAILLVIAQHGSLSDFFIRSGWVGVDLFFVLSGFLISGLLFKEYQRTGSIGLRRFFIRRGFKIYPAFYVYLAFIATIQFLFLRLSPFSSYLHEALFVQNYLGGIFGHTWSLAVEEHFYIALPLILLAMMKISKNTADPFRGIPLAFLAVAVCCQASRAAYAFSNPPNFPAVYYRSHNRIDALFFGVLIGYACHFRFEAMKRFIRPVGTRISIGALSLVFLLCAYFFLRETGFFGAIGYVLIYLGCGGMLVLSLFVQDVLPKTLASVLRPVGAVMAWVGMYSYSIYLWHGLVGAYLLGRARKQLRLSLSPHETFVLFLVESLVVGILMSKVVEYPALRLRERLFPAAVSAGIRTATDTGAIPSARPETVMLQQVIQ